MLNNVIVFHVAIVLKLPFFLFSLYFPKVESSFKFLYGDSLGDAVVH